VTATFTVFDPLLGEAGAAAMVDVCEAFGRYGTYAVEGSGADIGAGLPQRYDTGLNFVKTGGRLGNRGDDVGTLIARTNYFRETFAYGDDVVAEGVQPFLHHQGFVDAARVLHGREVVVPSIVYANLLLPGQELSVHTDVPEFRGANRHILPQWLMVVMHHSGRFERWRMPIATGIAYFGTCEAGELAFYPDGADGPVQTFSARHDTAIMLDTDSVFHGVDRVGRPDEVPEGLDDQTTLVHEGNGTWSMVGDGEQLAAYRDDRIRYSVSWKAYCFADGAERDAWADHADDLTVEFILDTLEDELRERRVLSGPRPEVRPFAELLIDELIHFPPAVGEPAG
jgi:hypothetical protein